MAEKDCYGIFIKKNTQRLSAYNSMLKTINNLSQTNNYFILLITSHK